MCKILRAADDFVMSPKGTVIRGKSNVLWREVIGEMYEDIEGNVSNVHVNGKVRQ